ncbi:hypothetical protein DRP04_12295 [Archaeoglobales archaeon]|nr:MAG: hypothetical protein DRP04_12295 [Archaeoglobales archaeon]
MIRAKSETYRRVRTLKPWEEVIGVLLSIEEDEDFLIVKLSSATLCYHASSKEAGIIGERLNGKVGRRVSILATDNFDEPFKIWFHSE